MLYFLNKEGETIGLVKTKSGWYIILRSLREKAVYTFTTAKKQKSWSIEHQIQSMCTRLDSIQDWLQCSNSYLAHWKVRDLTICLAVPFMEYFNVTYFSIVVGVYCDYNCAQILISHLLLWSYFRNLGLVFCSG